MQIPGEDDMPVAREISQATDRSAAILATSWLDEYLTTALRSRLHQDRDTANKLFKPSGPLGALTTKIELGYLLEFYNKETRDDLIHISGIRNLFAHWTKTIDFGSRDIRIAVEGLTLFHRVWSGHQAYESMKPPKPFTKEHARQRFLSTVSIAVNVLNSMTKNSSAKYSFF